MISLPPPSVLSLPAAILGLVMGSFVTALSYRQPRAQSVAHGRSKCPACGHVLAARDLVPVVSWLANRGSCRHCGAPVSWRYPVIELVTMGLFVAGVWLVADPRLLLALALMTVVVVALAVIDLEQQRLPDALLVALLVLALAWRWLADGDFRAAALAAAVVFAIGVLLNAAFRVVAGKPGLGMGDTKLLAAAAVALPVGPLLLFLAAAGGLGVAFGLVWRWRRGATQFPFGPPVLAAYWMSLAGGGAIMNAVISRLGGGPS